MFTSLPPCPFHPQTMNPPSQSGFLRIGSKNWGLWEVAQAGMGPPSPEHFVASSGIPISLFVNSHKQGGENL